MATYAIGDLQGCYRSLVALLDKIHFSDSDQLWLAGDLVNRGPNSLEVLRFIHSLGDRAQVVLGNHDLHLLAIASGIDRKLGKTLKPIMSAPDRDELLHWLKQQPLLHDSVDLGFVMSHAGIPHIWDLTKAKQLANEVQSALKGEYADQFFQAMYGNSPSYWNDQWSGYDRLRVITNYYTRMRFIAANGELDFEANGGVDKQPSGYTPWFEQPTQITERTQITGHWAGLGLRISEQHIGLDTGCVWGGQLTALRLEDKQIFQIDSQD